MKDIILFVVGIIVGVMNAIAGGGMLIGFPAMIALGISPLLANATSSMITGPGQLSAAIGYRKYLGRVPKKYAWLLIPTVIGAAGGALLLRHTSPTAFAKIIPLLLLLGVIIFAFQPVIRVYLHRHIKLRSHRVLPLVFIGLALLPVSFYGGYFGAGYGLIMLAFLSFATLPDTHMINAMKNVAATFVSVTVVICLYTSHLIQWRIGIIMAVGAIIGGYMGARLAQRVSSHWLRVLVIIIGLSLVVYLALHHY